MVRARSIAQILNADNKPEDEDILEEYSCTVIGRWPAISWFFSAKLRSHQQTSIFYEVQKLSSAVSVKNYCPFIIQYQQNTRVLTDSRPCLMTYGGLCLRKSRSIDMFVHLKQIQIKCVQRSRLSNPAVGFLKSHFTWLCKPFLPVTQLQESVARCVTTQDILKGISDPQVIRKVSRKNHTVGVSWLRTYLFSLRARHLPFKETH